MNCPVCKASNELVAQCRRCKADLSLLLALEQQRAAELARAKTMLLQGQWEDAIAAANQADRLRSGADVRRLRALANVLRRDFMAAWSELREPAPAHPV